MNKLLLLIQKLRQANTQSDVQASRRRALKIFGSIIFLTILERFFIACSGGFKAGSATSSSTGGGGATPGYDGTIKIQGNAMVNGSGANVQLRGANIQQHCVGMIDGYLKIGSTGVPDASGGTGAHDGPATTTGAGAATTLTSIGPNTTYMQPWKFNTIRVGINEACWMGYTCYRSDGLAVNPDNYGAYPNLSYQKQIIQQVAQLNAAGYYVILTLAWTNPGRSLPLGQDIMANQDNSIQCWQSIASVFGFPNGTALKMNGGAVDNRGVIFEMFNEPITFEQEIYQGGFVNSGYAINAQGMYGLKYMLVYPYPCAAPTGAFTPGETITLSGGITAQVLCYYQNNTTGYASSGSQFIHLYNFKNGTTLFSPTNTTIAVGTLITGNTSKATTTTAASPTSGATYGWYMAGAIQLVAAVRATGAGNICLFSGSNYSHYLNHWLTYGAGTDATAPTGWDANLYGSWASQIGAHWHPYPAFSTVSAVSVASGGSGYAVNDTLLLQMDESGDANSGNCYYQLQLIVTSIATVGATTGVITGVSVNKTYIGGIPNAPAGTVANSGQFPVNSTYGNGIWTNVSLPAVVAQDAGTPKHGTAGIVGTNGTGATFNLTYNDMVAGGGADLTDWPTVLAIKTAGYPVAITETGEHTGTGIVGSPYMAALTSWCDTNNIGLVAFAYTPASSWYMPGGCDFSLVLTTLTGSPAYRTPTPGYGEFMFNWFSNHSI